jgi:FHS family Na+ dependent glucose MFS transporter 1
MRLNPKQVLWIDFAGCIIWSLVLLVFDSADALWSSAAFFGLFMASIFPTVLTLAETFIVISGKVATVFVVGASLGELALPAAVGHMFVSLGAVSFAWATVLFSVLSLVVFICVVRVGDKVAESTKSRTNEESGDEGQVAILEFDMLKAPRE